MAVAPLVSQVPPLPLGHVVHGRTVQNPPSPPLETHVSPAAHVGCPPWTSQNAEASPPVPPALHVPAAQFGVAPEHVKQAVPPVPHAEAASAVWHVPVESQQPVAQLEGLQLFAVQFPPLQKGVPPVQLLHAAPPEPQLLMDSAVWQVPVESQHPVGQLVAVQPPEFAAQICCAEHVCDEPQSWHVTPPLPQALDDVPATHVPALQQPFGQLVGVQLLELPQAAKK
jgi:hypothetical protein